MVFLHPIPCTRRLALSVLALSSRFDGQGAGSNAIQAFFRPFSTRSVESF